MKRLYIISKFLTLFLFLFFSFNFSCYANFIEKEIEIDLPKDYLQCTFYITSEKESVMDEVYIYTPNEKKIEGVYNESLNQVTFNLENAKAGIYTVKVLKDVSDEMILPEEKSKLKELSDSEIGKITISVTADTEETQAIDNNIKLAKEISGLQYYWKDDSIVITWDDENIGNVDIQIVDSNTLEIITSKKVSECYFEYPISPSIEEIILFITPSVSHNIKGAGEQFIIPVVNNPEGTVTFEDVSYTNKDYIAATVDLKECYSLLYTNNDIEVGKTEQLDAGVHEIQIPTSIGENNIKVYIIDENHNMRSTFIHFIKDIDPPILKIQNDINGLETKETQVSVTGYVEDYDYLIFRNENVDVEWDGTFSIDIELKEGINEINLVASDKAGNKIEYKATVTKPVPQSFSINSYVIYIIIFFFVLILIFFIRKTFMNFSFQSKVKEIHRNNTKNIKIREKSSSIDLICFIISLIIYGILIFFVFEFAFVESSSMEPTIKKEEIVVTNKLAYVHNKPERGDIVTFTIPNTNTILIKRIIGLPGDTISFVDGYVFINGIICDENKYLNESIESNSSKTFQVPENHYFFLGDNRENSFDSRYWDSPYISLENIHGKLLLHLDFSFLYLKKNSAD